MTPVHQPAYASDPDRAPTPYPANRATWWSATVAGCWTATAGHAPGNRSRIQAERRAIRDRVAAVAVDLTRHIAARAGAPALFELCGDLMAERGVAELDAAFDCS